MVATPVRMMTTTNRAKTPPDTPSSHRRHHRRSTPSRAEIARAMQEAKIRCSSGNQQECAVAWDVVEELCAAAHHAYRGVDALDILCEETPWADECRIYDI